MTTNSWKAGGGLFNFGTENGSDSDWLLNHTPTTSEDAVINTGASAAVIGATSNEDVGSISLGSNDTLLIGNGSIFATVNGTGPNVNNGTININDADLVIGNTSNTSTFDNGSTGSIVLNGTGANAPAVLFVQGSVNLTGSGTIQMEAGDPAADNVIVGDFFDGGTNTLTDKTEDISGSGTIGGDLNFINDATVESQNGTLIIEGSAGTGGFTNNGTVKADNGGTVVFGEDGQSSTIVNNATVELDTTGSTTSLEIAGNVTLSGGGGSGQIVLTGSNAGVASDFDQVVSDGHAATLTLVNQTLKGAGTVGDAHLTLNNQSGTIAANDSGEPLQLTTGSHTILNGGTIEAVNYGLLDIESPVNSTGTIQAVSGGTINASAAITGSVNVGANSVLYLTGNGSVSGNVTLSGADTQIWLDNGGPHDGLNGNIVGAQAGDIIINFLLLYSPSMQVVWTQTSSSGGTLALEESGSTISTYNLTGQYDASDFSVTQFIDGSVQINLPNPIGGAGMIGAMIMRDGSNGAYQIYDLGNNGILASYQLGQTSTAWQVAGIGGFFGADTSDMILRNSSTGAFEVEDISNNNETDMLMRNSATGAFEIYDISNNQITNAVAMGQVGLEWQVVGFGPINAAGQSDMLMRNTNTGAFEVYDIANNQLVNATSMGQVGTEWSVAGIASNPPGSSPANAQLAQAMAAFGATGGSVDAGGPFGQPMAPSMAVGPLVPANGQVHQA